MEHRQRDYLMRQIEELGIVIAALLGFKQDGRIEDGIKHIQITLQNRFQIELADLEAMPSEDILAHLLKTSDFSEADLHFAAELLYQHADFLNLDGQIDHSLEMYRRALPLFRHLQEHDLTFSLDRWHKIDRIESLLRLE